MLDVESALALALRHRGAEVHAVICDGSYRGCILRAAALHASVASWGKAGSSEPGWSCSECRDTCSSRLKQLGVPHSFIGDHLQFHQVEALRRSTDGISWSSLDGLTYDSLPVGKNARSSVYRYLKGADVNGHEDAIREFATSALLSASAAQRVLEWFAPTRVVMSHGVYADWGPALQVALARGIPVSAWMASYQTARFYFRNVEAPDRVDLHNMSPAVWQSIAAQNLTPSQDRRLTQYLEKRYQQNVAFDLKGMTPFHGNTAELRTRYALSPDKPTWGIMCHINWDAVVDGSPMVYGTLDDWLIDTIAHAVETSGVQWVVKVHPAEAWLNTTHGVPDLVRRVFPHLPAHVKVMPAVEKISPLDFMNLVDGGVTAYGTGGLELAVLGKPVILAGEAHYGRKGFTHDGLRRSDYTRLLRQAGSLGPLGAEQRRQSKTYAYTYFVTRQIPFPVVYAERSSWWEFRPDRAQCLETGRDPFVEFICSKILSGGDFIMPDPLVELAETEQWMTGPCVSAVARGPAPEGPKSRRTSAEPDRGPRSTPEVSPLAGFDPLGEVFSWNGRILRGVFKGRGQRVRSVVEACEKASLFSAGIIPTSVCPSGDWDHMGYDLVLEHQPVRSVSYAFEWPPSMFKDAALFQLELAKTLLQEQLVLKDCGVTANVAFDATQPRYVDFLSIIPRADLVEQTWLTPTGFHTPLQLLWSPESALFNEIFCRMFYPGVLFPLYLITLRGYELARQRVFETVLNTTHDTITPHEAFQGVRNGTEARYQHALSGREHALVHDDWGRFIDILHREIDGIEVALSSSNYTTYYDEKKEDFGFTPSPEWKPKQRAVYESLRKLKPHTVLDIGANTGWFSMLAAREGARVLAMDSDPACMDLLYRRAKHEGLPIQTVVMNFAKPTPEVPAHSSLASDPRRQSSHFTTHTPLIRPAAQRMQSELVLGLAILHHLVLGSGIALEDAIASLAGYAEKSLLVEFVAKDDSLVAGEPQFFKAHHRNPSGFLEYTEAECRRSLSRHFRVVEHVKLTDTRCLFICSQRSR